LTKALKILVDVGINHGDVQPATIFITKDGGIKLMDLTSLGLKGTGYYRMYMGTGNVAALSPQL